MKKLILLATAFVFCFAALAQSQPQTQTGPKPEDVVKVNTEKYDFGKIKQGNPVNYAFELTNTSDKPLVVENSWASCGCTTPEKITEPIMPGKTAQLKVQYNAAAASPFTKDVYVKFAGIEQPKTLHIVGEVLTPEAYDVWVKENKDKEKEKTTQTSKTKDKSGNN